MLSANALRLAVGELGSRVPLLLLEVFLARVLGPTAYGIWSVIQTCATYGNFLHFGVSSSLARREPRLMVAGAQQEILANRAAAYGFQLLVIAIVVVTVIGFSSVFGFTFDAIGGKTMVFALLAVVLAQQIAITMQASALNEFKIIESSIARLVYAFGFFAIGLFVARFNMPLLWLTLGWAGALVVSLGVLNVITGGILVMPTIDPQRTVVMLKDGFLIMLQGLIRFGLMSVDKITVFLVARSEEIGFYGIGSLGASLTSLLGSMIARVSLPTLLRLNVRADSTKLMQAEFDHMLLLIQLSTFTVVFVICWIAPILILYVLPAYEPGIRVICILAVAGGFNGLAQALNDVTMSIGVKRAVLVNTVATLAIEILFLALAWSVGAGIEGTAASALLAMIFMSGRGLWLGMHVVGFSKPQVCQRLSRIALRAAFAVTLCFGVLEIQIHVISLLNSDTSPAFLFNAVLIMFISSWVVAVLRRLRGHTLDD